MLLRSSTSGILRVIVVTEVRPLQFSVQLYSCFKLCPQCGCLGVDTFVLLVPPQQTSVWEREGLQDPDERGAL